MGKSAIELLAPIQKLMACCPNPALMAETRKLLLPLAARIAGTQPWRPGPAGVVAGLSPALFECDYERVIGRCVGAAALLEVHAVEGDKFSESERQSGWSFGFALHEFCADELRKAAEWIGWTKCQDAINSAMFGWNTDMLGDSLRAACETLPMERCTETRTRIANAASYTVASTARLLAAAAWAGDRERYDMLSVLTRNFVNCIPMKVLPLHPVNGQPRRALTVLSW